MLCYSRIESWCCPDKLGVCNIVCLLGSEYNLAIPPDPSIPVFFFMQGVFNGALQKGFHLNFEKVLVLVRGFN